LHVIDASDPDREEKRQVVLDVLKDIGAGDHPILTVYNKSDLLDGNAPENGLLVSAATGEGLTGLVEEIVQYVSPVRI
jgi:GTP-binding protein HflX